MRHGSIIVITGYARIIKSGRLPCRSIGSLAAAFPASNFVPAEAVRCPPAENPNIPTWSTATPYSAAFARTVRIAR